MNEICQICAASMQHVFTTMVLGKYDVRFYCCGACGFLRTERPYWLADAYSAAIASTDVGLVMRNKVMASRLTAFLYFVASARRQDRFLDAAGGYGLLVRMMRDNGFDYYWQDQYCANLFAAGFELSPETLNEKPFMAVSAVEVMEHLADPFGFVSALLQQTTAQIFVFTTELYEGSVPSPEQWWYYSLETGQHIAFFQRRTLQKLASRLGMHFVSYRGLHVFAKDPINAWQMKLATGRLHPLASTIAARRLSARTSEDHRAALERLHAAQRSPATGR